MNIIYVIYMLYMLYTVCYIHYTVRLRYVHHIHYTYKMARGKVAHNFKTKSHFVFYLPAHISYRMGVSKWDPVW